MIAATALETMVMTHVGVTSSKGHARMRSALLHRLGRVEEPDLSLEDLERRLSPDLLVRHLVEGGRAAQLLVLDRHHPSVQVPQGQEEHPDGDHQEPRPDDRPGDVGESGDDQGRHAAEDHPEPGEGQPAHRPRARLRSPS